MNRFVLLFNEREGTSAFIRLLDNFQQISLIRREGDVISEPFDRHNCGPMTPRNFTNLFHLLFDDNALNINKINHIYTKTSHRAITPYNKNKITGFKMRLYNGIYLPYPRYIRMFLLGFPITGNFLRRKREDLFFDLIKTLKFTVFLAIRQDVFRKALSKYYSNNISTGNVHPQFDIANGKLNPSGLPKIFVKPKQLEKYLDKSKQEIIAQRILYRQLKKRQIPVFPLLYEDFLMDKVSFIKTFFRDLGHIVSDEDIQKAIKKGNPFKKVHSNDISDFVINGDELEKKYGHEYNRW